MGKTNQGRTGESVVSNTGGLVDSSKSYTIIGNGGNLFDQNVGVTSAGPYVIKNSYESVPLRVTNRVTLQLNGQVITPEIISDPESRKQKVQLCIHSGQTLVTLESPVELENMRSLAQILLDWADAIEIAEGTNVLTGNK
jgi:hypothetical protein